MNWPNWRWLVPMMLYQLSVVSCQLSVVSWQSCGQLFDWFRAWKVTFYPGRTSCSQPRRVSRPIPKIHSKTAFKSTRAGTLLLDPRTPIWRPRGRPRPQMGVKMEPKCIPKWVPSPFRESTSRLSAKPIIYYVLATFWWCPKPSKTAFCLPNSRSGCSAHLLATKESSKSVWGAILKPFYAFLFSPWSPKDSLGMSQK